MFSYEVESSLATSTMISISFSSTCLSLDYSTTCVASSIDSSFYCSYAGSMEFSYLKSSAFITIKS
jgi:hypothetical protein